MRFFPFPESHPGNGRPVDVNGVVRVRVMPCGCGIAAFHHICIRWWVERKEHAKRYIVSVPVSRSFSGLLRGGGSCMCS